jgi:hypothetical protein
MILAPARMSGLLSDIVPLALGAAISPVIFLLQLTTLTVRARLHADPR